MFSRIIGVISKSGAADSGKDFAVVGLMVALVGLLVVGILAFVTSLF